MIRAIFLAMLMPGAAFPVLAQDTVLVYVDRYVDASSGPARRAVSVFNAARTTRFFREARISRTRSIDGDVGVLNGPLLISGVVRGDVVALNSDVILRDDAVVHGDITVFGGEIFGLRDATVRGSTRAYTSSIRVERDGRRVRLRDEPDRPRRPTRSRARDNDRTDFDITLNARTYNRVEGLPLKVGPRWQFPVDDLGTLTLEGLAVIRTAGDFDDTRRDFGYEARAELSFGRSNAVSLGIRAYDVVAPVENWKLGDNEIGFATFLWHRDYRDYFLRRGVTGYVTFSTDRDFTFTAEIGNNEDESVLARDPWTPFRNDEAWRVNPPIDEGTFTTISTRLEYDSRNERGWGGSGWYLALEWERGQSDSVAALALPTSIRAPIPSPDYTYDRAVVDIRRYERFGRAGQFAFRAYGAGTIGNEPLPVQRRLSLGGPEPLPGFNFRHLACNQQTFSPGNAALCDRLVLFQAEYRRDLSFSTPWRAHNDTRRPRDRDIYDWDDWFWFDGPVLVLFGNAGTAWIDEDGPGELQADIGAGITFGGFGIYGAKAVSVDESMKVLLRLDRRF